MSAAPTPENLLTVTAYGATNRVRQILDAIELLNDMHGARKMATSEADIDRADMRCITCYLPTGEPAPFPCDTFVRFSALFDMPIPADTIELFRSLGVRTNALVSPRRRAIAGRKPHTP